MSLLTVGLQPFTVAELVEDRIDERTMDLGRTATAAATARHWLDCVLPDLGVSADGPRIDVARLLLSELVANVFLHTSSTAVASVGVHGGDLLVSVTDAGDGQPHLATRPPLASSGRGLRLVAEQAREWGVVDLSPNGKAVWFAISLGEGRLHH